MRDWAIECMVNLCTKLPALVTFFPLTVLSIVGGKGGWKNEKERAPATDSLQLSWAGAGRLEPQDSTGEPKAHS